MLKFIQKLTNINLAIQLLILFAFTFLAGPFLGVEIKSALFAISMTLKEILLFLLPVIIFVCLFYSMVSNQNLAFRFVLILFVTVCCSNFISLMAAYGMGIAGLSYLSTLMNHQAPVSLVELKPLWSFHLPCLCSNEWALLSGFVLGTIASFFQVAKIEILAKRANKSVTWFLNKLFVPVLPLFALGFMLKMEHEGILLNVVQGYGPIILLIFIACVVYLALMFAIAANFKVAEWVRYIQNILPAGLLGFSTMSSLAAMPVTLSATEKSTHNPELTRAVIPTTVNTHMLGDSIVMPILAMAVLLSFGHSLPSFVQYWALLQVYMVAKLAIPAIPGGSILVMLPLLEKYLGFSPEMSAFITAIYILFDPILTAANVLGNSALAIIFSRIMKRKTGSDLELGHNV